MALGVALGGCVTLPPESLPIAHNPAGSTAREFEDPGPGLALEPSDRFLVKACGVERAQAVSRMAEQDYQRIIADAGLWHFRPGGLYPIVVYRDADEYLRKTGAPPWSGGIAVGNAIYTYEGPGLARTLAHEITHLLFHEYMGGRNSLRWFNEGLAVYEEMQAAESAQKPELEEWLAASHKRPMPLAELAAYSPGDSRTRAWYGQSASVVRYLVETGGRSGVEKFLQAAKGGANLDQAVAAGFPALCDSLAALEKHWLAVRN
ncbi:MAG: hypothetical protein A2X36_06315 [Elusimicrobia bacterium GWA2_69_24]|nr:MAG: hypothetical protein A2X36_06315 [Elusimicrobia bacterium GWA2_69_24]HBL15790.1 hypothetical protein [Elusimicrobiota bacterium]